MGLGLENSCTTLRKVAFDGEKKINLHGWAAGLARPESRRHRHMQLDRKFSKPSNPQPAQVAVECVLTCWKVWRLMTLLEAYVASGTIFGSKPLLTNTMLAIACTISTLIVLADNSWRKTVHHDFFLQYLKFSQLVAIRLFGLQHADRYGRLLQVLHSSRQQAWHRSQHALWQGRATVFHPYYPSTN